MKDHCLDIFNIYALKDMGPWTIVILINRWLLLLNVNAFNNLQSFFASGFMEYFNIVREEPSTNPLQKLMLIMHLFIQSGNHLNK